MAKDLPYFKFFCSEWNDGNITLEDYKIQGVFINVCSYYWSKECNLSVKLLYKRFKDVSDEIDTLVSEKHIKVLDGYVVVNFLNEQLFDRENTSVGRRKGGLASAEARRLKKIEQESNTIPTEKEQMLTSCSTQVQLLREEKIREDKIIPYTQEAFFEDWNTLRTKHLKKPSFLNRIGSYEDKANFKELCLAYKRIDFQNAIEALFRQKAMPNGIKTLQTSPNHFLIRFERYLQAFHDKDTDLYGKKIEER